MGSTAEDFSTEPLAEEGQVRAAFEQAIAEDGRPLSQIAPETSVAYPTLAAWRAGKYAGNNAKVAEAVRQWLVAREAKRRTREALPDIPTFVMTQTASRIIEVLERARVLPDMAVIAGGAGIGKTTSIDWYRDHTPNVWMVPIQPILGTMRPMMEAIGVALGLNLHVYRGAEMSRSIVKLLTAKQGLLILDDAQHLTSEALDQLRSFHDLAGVGIALAGNETVFSRFGADRRTAQFAQLFSRVGQRFTRRDLTKGDLDILIDAWNLSDDDARKEARRIARLPGAARGMTKALRMAFILARGEGRNEPNQSDVKIAWGQLSGEQS